MIHCFTCATLGFGRPLPHFNSVHRAACRIAWGPSLRLHLAHARWAPHLGRSLRRAARRFFEPKGPTWALGTLRPSPSRPCQFTASSGRLSRCNSSTAAVI